MLGIYRPPEHYRWKPDTSSRVGQLSQRGIREGGPQQVGAMVHNRPIASCNTAINLPWATVGADAPAVSRKVTLVLSRNQPSVVEIDTKRINTLRYFERLLLTMLASLRYTIPILLVCSVASDSAQAGDSDPYFPKPTYFKSYFRRADTRIELQPPLHF